MQTPLEPFKFILLQTRSWGALFWVAGALTFPFYFFSGGSAQISTFFFAGAIVCGLMDHGFSLGLTSRSSGRFAFPFLLLVAYISLVQMFWSIETGSASLLVFSVYYAFSFLIFVSLVEYARRDSRILELVIKAIYCAVIIQAALSLLGAGKSEGIRSILFFQNPNQLGYFSLISACAITFGSKRNLIGTLPTVAGLLGCIWLAQLSLSKAAMLAGLVLLAYIFVRRPAVAVLIVLAGLSLYVSGVLDARVDVVGARISSLGDDGDDNWAGRGYDRIWLHPEMLILGGGEGAVWRWDSLLEDSEIHSSWGTLLFSYGIPGMCIAFFLFARIATSVGYQSLIPFMVVLLYGVTHMGLRFTPMWMFFAICAAVAVRERAARTESVSSGHVQA